MRERPAAGRPGRPRVAVPRVAVVAALALAAVLVVGTGPAPAVAEEVSGIELQALLRRAGSDPDALAALRRVDRVDGRPVDLRRALAGADGAALDGRLAALDPGPGRPGPATDPADGAVARADARRILEQRRFHPGAAPRPFRGLFRTLGRWLRPVSGPIARAWSAVSDDTLGVAILSAGVVGLAALTSLRIIRRRSSAGVVRAGRSRSGQWHDDPDALEGRAAEAERAGDLALALRLRFRAGLVRLDRAGVVADRPALTTGALTRQLPSPQLRALATTFDEVAYGGRPASPDDLAAARSGWPRVLEEVAR